MAIETVESGHQNNLCKRANVSAKRANAFAKGGSALNYCMLLLTWLLPQNGSKVNITNPFCSHGKKTIENHVVSFACWGQWPGNRNQHSTGHRPEKGGSQVWWRWVGHPLKFWWNLNIVCWPPHVCFGWPLNGFWWPPNVWVYGIKHIVVVEKGANVISLGPASKMF